MMPIRGNVIPAQAGTSSRSRYAEKWTVFEDYGNRTEIPAYAGMTLAYAGMTPAYAGTTLATAGTTLATPISLPN